LWVLLLEKAFAKMHGNYDNIIAGFCSQGLKALTGAPTKDHWHKYTPNIVDMLQEAEEKNWIMACGSMSVPNKWEDISSVGIVSSHAYSILSVHVVRTRKHGKIRLIQLRNPWG